MLEVVKVANVANEVEVQIAPQISTTFAISVYNCTSMYTNCMMPAEKSHSFSNM